ncbi:phage tail protein [Hymenobacter busanensis]|uniref:Phage tail protein n=1 Tax=Hymenobacter busanensis TaxID=2607656 RepID=A0A7L4ZWV5_9BACT|nr:tail fiber protein [Hymenobacter busanensis]KAA9333347.1 phage tail protein [Hymenobacter busanensis]QHJ07974.1 phage tail protein [Hymenobacter busanensis]
MDAFIGEIRPVGFGFAPHNWALCQGQLLAISSNTALFSILGTMYGGDGRVTFALPNLCGSAPVCAGQGAGLTQYYPGQMEGTEAETLQLAQMPAHAHGFAGTVQVSDGAGAAAVPDNNYFANSGASQYSENLEATTMAAASVSGTTSNAGGDQAHPNMMPYLGLNFAICLNGIFPQRP